MDQFPQASASYATRTHVQLVDLIEAKWHRSSLCITARLSQSPVHFDLLRLQNKAREAGRAFSKCKSKWSERENWNCATPSKNVFSLGYFGHSSRNSHKTRRKGIHWCIFSDIITKSAEFFLVIARKKFVPWQKKKLAHKNWLLYLKTTTEAAADANITEINRQPSVAKQN